MLDVDHISKVRLAHFRDGKGIREIARDLDLARNTVRSIIRSGITDQKYERTEQPRPKLGSFLKLLAKWLKEDSDNLSAIVVVPKSFSSSCSGKVMTGATMPSVAM